MRRTLIVLLAVSLLTTSLWGGSAVAQGPEGYDRGNVQLETTTGPTEEMPVTIDYDLWVPDGASASDPRPAMVVAHGFGNSKDVNEMITLGAFFAERGYVVITSSHQGFGGSSGCVALDSIDYDSRNVTRLIDVLAARDDVLKESAGDPIVGLVGGSYGGGHHGGVAALDPRLDAMSPGRTWNSLQYSLVPNNLIGADGLYDLEHYEQGVFKSTWSSLFYASGSTQPAMGNGGCDPVTQQTLYPGQPPCSGFDPVVCPIFANLRGSGDVTDEQRAVVARSSITNHVGGVNIPVLLTQGQSDTLFTLVEATATFDALRDKGRRDVQMIWNSGGHGYPPAAGEGEPYSGAFDDTAESQALFRSTFFAEAYGRFFDFHLRGEGHPGPVFAYHPSWGEPDSDGVIGFIRTGDAPTNDGVSYHLDDSGLLPINPTFGPGTSDVPATLSATLAAPGQGGPLAHSETPNFSGPGEPGAERPPSEVSGQHIALDTPAFTAPATTVGFPTVTVEVANANGQDAILFTKLYDVAPDGTATLLRRLVAASRIPADQLPGQVSVRVPGVAHRFPAGHSARLVIATTDDSYRNATVADQITLSSDENGSAQLHLPLVGADQIGRIAGADRVQTAIELSEHAFPLADQAVIVAADQFADALSAGPLAAALAGPLLLTGSSQLDERVAADLSRLGTTDVTLVGGPASLSPAVAEALEAAGLQVQRVSGPDRYTTAAEVARLLMEMTGRDATTAIVARGGDFADALSAGSLAATLGVPVLLADPGQTQAAASVLAEVLADGARIVIAGGENAVPSSVAGALGVPFDRAAGPDRYATGVALAQLAIDAGASPNPLLLASGATFPDALAAVPAAHAIGGMVLTVPPTGVQTQSATAEWLSARAAVADAGYLVGGPAVLPDPVATSVEAHLVAAGDGG